MLRIFRIWPDLSDTVQLIIFYIHLVNFVAVSTLKGKLQTLTNEKKYNIMKLSYNTDHCYNSILT